MADYLTPEQKAEFIRSLESQGGVPDGSNGGAETALSPEAQQQAMAEGAQMAAADAQSGAMPGADAQAVGEIPAQQTDANAQQGDVQAQVLSQLGFGSVEELANAYREAARSQSEMREMLTQITALQQAAGNEEQLDPNNPEDRVKLVVRGEIQPLLEKQKADARNKMVQEKWNASPAAKAADLSELMPEIQAYLSANPRLAVDEEGLQRAYDAVRSGKYRSERDMMADPEFVKRAAADEGVKKRVIEEYLQSVARNGDVAPQGITEGGSVPLTGKKTGSHSMAQARQKLESMLGVKR